MLVTPFGMRHGLSAWSLPRVRRSCRKEFQSFPFGAVHGASVSGVLFASQYGVVASGSGDVALTAMGASCAQVRQGQ